MPIRKQGLPIKFEGGVSTKTDAKQVPATQLLDLQNATFVRDSALAKRNGYRALGRQIDGAASTYTDAKGIASRDDELVVITETSSYSYRPASNTWSTIGDVASVTASTVPLARSGSVQTAPDAATCSGITALAWEDSRGGVWCSTIEQNSGRVLLPATQLDANARAISPRCLRVGTVLHVIYARADLRRLYLAVIDPALPFAVPVATILTEDLLTTNPVYDAQPTSLGATYPGTAVIAWAVAGGYRLGYLDASGALGSPLFGYPSVVTKTVAFTGPIAVTAEELAATTAVLTLGTVAVVDFWDASTATFVLSRTATTNQSGVGAARATCAFLSDSTGALGLWMAWDLDGNGNRTDTSSVVGSRILAASSSLDTVASQSILRGMCLASRAWRDGIGLAPVAATDINGHVYICVAHPVQFFPYVAVVRLSAATGFGGATTTCVARLLPGDSTGMLRRRLTATSYEHVRHLPSVTEVGLVPASASITRTHSIPLGYRIQLSSSSGDQFSEAGIKVAVLGFAATSSCQTAQFGRGLYMAGACAQHYDGAKWGEATMHSAPDVGYDRTTGAAIDAVATIVQVDGGAPGPGVGTYLYKMWYEHVDAQGELHVGATRSMLVVVASAAAVGINIPTYRNTSRAKVRLCVARSAKNPTGADASIPLYRVTGTDPTVQGYTNSNAYVENDPTVDSVLFYDNLLDLPLIAREPLYTNGGIYSNDPEPWNGAAIVSGKGRVFWLDPTDPNVVCYSQGRRDDTALEAPRPLNLVVDPYGGAIVGLAILDDALIILKKTAIYVVGGPGPDADGSVLNNAFSPAALVTADVGCNSASSIAQTPDGIVFSTTKGIYMLGRDRSVHPIGEAVYAYKDQHVSRATLLPDRHQVVFLTDTADGRALLWDYVRNQWSTYTNHVGLDGIVVAGTYYYLRPDGRVFAETPGVFVDDNSHIPMVIETAWIKMSGYLQGWQKVINAFFIGRWISSHTFRMRFRIDYNEAYSAPIDVNPDANQTGSKYGNAGFGDGPYGGAGGDTTRYQTNFHINRRCQAISFRVEDVEATTTYGAAYELSELLLIGGVIGPSFVPGAARQA